MVVVSQQYRSTPERTPRGIAVTDMWTAHISNKHTSLRLLPRTHNPSLTLAYEMDHPHNSHLPAPCDQSQISLTTHGQAAVWLPPTCVGLRTNRPVGCPLSRKQLRAQNNPRQLHTTSSQRSQGNDGGDAVLRGVFSVGACGGGSVDYFESI